MMRILVTGASGFVGSNIARALCADGHEVFATGTGGEQKVPPSATLFPSIAAIDWRKIGTLDALVHEAAITDTSVHDRAEMLRVNVKTSKTLFEQARGHGASRIVYASSTAVYGNLPGPLREDGPTAPLNVYGESKVLLDEYAMTFAAAQPRIRVVGLRYCNVYGPGESHKGPMASMVYRLAGQMQKGNPRLFKWGEQAREYIYIDDVVRANVLALQAGTSAYVNCATGAPRTFNDLVAILNTALGTSRTPEYIDNPHPETYQSHIECDVSRAKEILGFEAAYDLESGVAAYLASGALTAA